MVPTRLYAAQGISQNTWFERIFCRNLSFLISYWMDLFDPKIRNLGRKKRKRVRGLLRNLRLAGGFHRKVWFSCWMMKQSSEDWLPPGWTVEVKVRKSGKKDKVMFFFLWFLLTFYESLIFSEFVPFMFYIAVATGSWFSFFFVLNLLRFCAVVGECWWCVSCWVVWELWVLFGCVDRKIDVLGRDVTPYKIHTWATSLISFEIEPRIIW